MSSTPRKPPPVYRPNAAVPVQRKPGISAPPVYNPSARSAVAAPSVYRPNAAVPVQRKQGISAPPIYRPQAAVSQRKAVIQRIEKPLADGSTVDVEEEELEESWVPRLLDDEVGTLHLWRRKGTNPQTYNADTFYSLDSGSLKPLTADAVNAYWDKKYPGFTRSGSPDHKKNCQDYACEGHSSYRDGTKYDLSKESDRLALEKVLESGNHVLQLGPLKLTAHFLRVLQQGSGVKISQKDGDSAIYEKDMSAKDAVTYIYGKASNVMELYRA